MKKQVSDKKAQQPKRGTISVRDMDLEKWKAFRNLAREQRKFVPVLLEELIDKAVRGE